MHSFSAYECSHIMLTLCFNTLFRCIGCQNSYGDYARQKDTVWTMTVLEAEDQLCQRNAWSLYELLNVGTASNPQNTESNLYTYDIFVRNCFGSYFDVLKEMTFNSKMAEQFNFVDSAAARLSWDTSGTLVFPDENYAREVCSSMFCSLSSRDPTNPHPSAYSP